MASIRYIQRGKRKLWSFQVRDEFGKNIKQQSGFETKMKAKEAGNHFMTVLSQGGLVNDKMTLLALYDTFLELKVIPNREMAQGTKEKYTDFYRKKIKLFFDIPVVDIKHSSYQEKMNQIGLSVNKKNLSRINGAIKKALQLSRADGHIFRDFTDGVVFNSPKIGKSREERFIHSEADYLRLRDELKERFDYKRSITAYMLWGLLEFGMRPAELAALRIDDYNPKNQTLHTWQRLNLKTYQFVNKKRAQDSDRYIGISKEDCHILDQCLSYQKEYNKKAGCKNQNNLIFQHYGYQHDIPNGATLNKELKKVMSELNIYPTITIYGCRHSRISYLLGKGFKVDEVAKICGTSPRMIQEVYGHLLKERDSDLMDRLKKI